MAIYVVTGKLGSGKTIACVGRINEAIGQGRRIATNLDLWLPGLPNVSRYSRSPRVIRIPDLPTRADVDALGYGIEGVNTPAQAKAAYDESRFGLLVLDEAGTWLNSRDWQAEGRRELLDLLLHIRKRLWDVYFIIQDISLLDKQFRKALAEHTAWCRRLDRLSIPVVTWVGSLAGLSIRAPKMHYAQIRYGDQPNSVIVDRWAYRGTALYPAYDTTQAFSPEYESGPYSVLPPWYHNAHSKTRWDWRKAMRLTQIYLRQWSKTTLLASGIFAGAVVVHALGPDADPVPLEDVEIRSGEQIETDDAEADTPALRPTRIGSYSEIRGAGPVPEWRHEFQVGQGRITSGELIAQGWGVRVFEACRVQLQPPSGRPYYVQC